MTKEAAYSELVDRLKRAHVLGTVNGLISWDEQVNLPPDSADLRAEQLARQGKRGLGEHREKRGGQNQNGVEHVHGKSTHTCSSAPRLVESFTRASV